MIVKNNKKQILGNHLLTLLPGVNDVLPKAWEEFSKSPSIRHFIAEGEIEVLEIPKAAATPASPIQIDKLNQKDALALVRATFDKALLERWAVSESRKPVLDALERQLDGLKLPKKDASKEEPEDDETEEA